jgi:hypothetical protein
MIIIINVQQAVVAYFMAQIFFRSVVLEEQRKTAKLSRKSEYGPINKARTPVIEVSRSFL